MELGLIVCGGKRLFLHAGVAAGFGCCEILRVERKDMILWIIGWDALHIWTRDVQCDMHHSERYCTTQ